MLNRIISVKLLNLKLLDCDKTNGLYFDNINVR